MCVCVCVCVCVLNACESGYIVGILLVQEGTVQKGRVCNEIYVNTYLILSSLRTF